MERRAPEPRPTDARQPDSTQGAPPDLRLIAGGEGWQVFDYVCHAGPQDRPFEERHDEVTIGAVLQGTFTYRTDTGRALMHPGSLVLGNHGACFECGHDHGTGDRCIVFRYAPAFFAEIAATQAGAGRYRFGAAMLPAANRLTPVIAGIEVLAANASPLGAEEAVTNLAETVVATLSGHTAPNAKISTRDERRIADVLRHMEEHADEVLDLDGLAAIAGISKYHFLRCFRHVVGMTPYQFLLTIRMRRAALRLTVSSQTVASIAFEAGFGDLSTFNTRFRSVLGVSPLGYRRRSSAAG
jgi:AraC family transcriptional regulator